MKQQIIKAKPGERIIIETNSWIFDIVTIIGGHYLESDGKNTTLYRALACLPGKTVQEAVKIANERHPNNKITSREFRRWFCDTMSVVFEEYMKGVKR